MHKVRRKVPKSPQPKRSCLMCRKDFTPMGPYIFVCDRCKESVAWNDVSGEEYESNGSGS
jgi:predicted amidophosphoribosyltransferase